MVWDSGLGLGVASKCKQAAQRKQADKMSRTEGTRNSQSEPEHQLQHTHTHTHKKKNLSRTLFDMILPRPSFPLHPRRD